VEVGNKKIINKEKVKDKIINTNYILWYVAEWEPTHRQDYNAGDREAEKKTLTKIDKTWKPDYAEAEEENW